MNINRQQFFEQPRLDVDLGPEIDPEVERRNRAGREMARFGDLNVQVDPYALRGIAETGDIRTQHEVGDSGGFYDPGMRGEIEKALGYDDNPVYGYVADKAGVDSGYGDARFTMKSSVKDRTTLYPDDSWYAYEEIAFGEEEGELAPPVPMGEGVPTTPGGPGFAEAHIHHDPARPETRGQPWSGAKTSRVPLSDVHRLEITLPSTEGPTSGYVAEERERSIAAGQQFSQIGVPTDFLERETRYQPPLPFSGAELHSQGFGPAHGRTNDLVRENRDPRKWGSENRTFAERRIRAQDMPSGRSEYPAGGDDDLDQLLGIR